MAQLVMGLIKFYPIGELYARWSILDEMSLSPQTMAERCEFCEAVLFEEKKCLAHRRHNVPREIVPRGALRSDRRGSINILDATDWREFLRSSSTVGKNFTAKQRESAQGCDNA